MPRLLAIGATVGATEALEDLLRALPADLPVPVVVAHPRDEVGRDGLLERLWARCALPVSEPDDKDAMNSGHLYLAPVGYHLLVDEASFSLCCNPPEAGQRPAIDPLFETAADAYGPQAVGVLLWAGGLDGWEGLGALRALGGEVAVCKVSPPGGRIEVPDALSRGLELVPPEGIAPWLLGRCAPPNARVGT